MNFTKYVCLFSLPKQQTTCSKDSHSNNCHKKNKSANIHFQTIAIKKTKKKKKTIHLGQDLTPSSVSFDSGGF
ncbi:hypothetical protein Hanom_Chr01g00020521 [Helianthus anomalus]